MSEKRVIITGASGMVGGCALRICLKNPDVSRVTVIGRSRTQIHDTRLREVVVDDFKDYSVLMEVIYDVYREVPKNGDKLSILGYGLMRLPVRMGSINQKLAKEFNGIVDDYDWTFCQIQYNYLDTQNQAGTAGLQYAASKDVAVIIMEPLRGGNLAETPPPTIKDIWAKAENKKRPSRAH